jgi:hypothetical protein
MKLLSVGDSFTYGEELTDRALSWPYVLGQCLGYEVTNLGQPGSGNTQIIRKVLENINNYDLIVIAWSHYARTEFADENGVYETWPGANLAIHNFLPYRKEIVNYITKYHNDLYFYQQYLINVLLLQGYLLQHKQRYLMVNSFGNNWNDFKDKNNITQLADQIDTNYFLGWPNNQMVEWAYGCPQGPGGHFLEEGHQRVADKINEHIRHLGWVS